MLVLKLELHSAITGKITHLGSCIIHNMGTGTKERGDYEILVGRKNISDLKDIKSKPKRTGRIYDYPRLSYDVWRLVIRSLLKAFPEELNK